MHISIPLENPYPVEITTALKFLFFFEKIDFEVWGAFLSRPTPLRLERSVVGGRFFLFLTALWMQMMMQ